MKKILAAMFLLAVCLNVRAFTPQEIAEAACSLPDKYLLRFIECTYDKSPAAIQKLVDELYVCVDEFYENNGKSDCIRILACYDDVKDDKDVQTCLIEKARQLEQPKPAEFLQLQEAAKNCLISAK